MAKDNWTIPVQNTLPDINPDEIFAAPRRGHARLPQAAGQRRRPGTATSRGGDLQDVFRRFEPTHRDLARVTTAVAERRQNLRRLIHSLNVLNGELASKSDDLSQLVDSSAAVFRAFASEDTNITRAVRDFPGALRQTTDTLAKVQRFADVLGPTAENLRPAVRALNVANKAITPFATQATPIVKNQIRPFVRDARPLVRQLRPASQNLAAATPDLTRSFVVLNHLFNMLGYNQNGREGPDVSIQHRDEGYLFWIAWLGHQGNTLFSSADAHSSFRPVTIGGTCGTLKASAPGAARSSASGLTGLLTNPAICG